MKKVLVLEDESNIRSFVVINLKRAGYEAIEAGTGAEALEQLKNNPDIGVAILDIMVPGDMDGFEVCRTIRTTNKSIGIIMLTARTQEMDKVTGLMTGADDYVTKPFSIAELMARIKANTRRKAIKTEKKHTEKIGDIEIDREGQTVTKGGKEIELTQREYDILIYFLTNSMRVISREELMENVWGYDYYGDLRAVDVAMRRLREKVETDPSDPQRIITKRGVGYYLKK